MTARDACLRGSVSFYCWGMCHASLLGPLCNKAAEPPVVTAGQEMFHIQLKRRGIRRPFWSVIRKVLTALTIIHSRINMNSVWPELQLFTQPAFRHVARVLKIMRSWVKATVTSAHSSIILSVNFIKARKFLEISSCSSFNSLTNSVSNFFSFLDN